MRIDPQLQSTVTGAPAGAERLGARSIRQKLFLWFLLQALFIIGAVTGVVAWSFDRGFLQYTAATNEQRTGELASALAAIHAETGSWQALSQDRRRWVNLVMRITGHDVDDDLAERLYEAFPARSFPSNLPAPLPMRFVLLDARQQVLLGPPADGPGRVIRPIGDPLAPVGYVGVNPGPSLRNIYDVAFYRQFIAGILGAAIAAVLIGFLLALAISRRFQQPIGAIAATARQLASGNYDARVAADTDDELGRLGQDIDELAIALGQHERLTKRWIADISHELRTPVALLRARLEAVQDGVRPLDRATADSLHGDVTRLALTIEDLYILSLSDSGALEYRMRTVDLCEVATTSVQTLADDFASRRLTPELLIDAAPGIRVSADPDRLTQMLVCLLTNSGRYTEAGGVVRVAVFVADGRAHLHVDDSPPAVAPEELPRIFDRLYRTDDSRSRRTGGAGLGLAIARSIVEAHGGSISAHPSTLGGLQVQVSLPILRDGP